MKNDTSCSWSFFFLSTLIFMMNTKQNKLVIDALWLCFIFTAGAADGWRPAARPAGQLAETQKTLRVSLRAEQRSSCWEPEERERNQRVSEGSQLFCVLQQRSVCCKLKSHLSQIPIWVTQCVYMFAVLSRKSTTASYHIRHITAHCGCVALLLR